MLNWHPYNQFDWGNLEHLIGGETAFNSLLQHYALDPLLNQIAALDIVVILDDAIIKHLLHMGVGQAGQFFPLRRVKLGNRRPHDLAIILIVNFESDLADAIALEPVADMRVNLDDDRVSSGRMHGAPAVVHLHARHPQYFRRQPLELVFLRRRELRLRRIADDLFKEIIIPLWAKGSSWWDVRASNYVVTTDGRLMMIDSDSVGAYADEILKTPKVFAERNHGSITAMKRYATILVTMAGRLAVRGTKATVQREVRALFVRQLQPVFVEPYPLPPGWKKSAGRAWQNFRAGYEALLRQPNIQPAPPK